MWNPIEDICFKNTLFSVFPPSYHVISISSEMLNHKREVASHCPVSFIILFQTFKDNFTYAHTLSFFPIFLCSFHVQVFAICLNYYWLFLQFIIVPQRPSFGCSLSATITTKKTKAVFPVCAIVFCVFNSFKFKYHSETKMLFCTHQKKKLRWRI